MKQIPLVDLKAQYHAIREEIDEAIQNILENSQFIMGEPVKRFEEEFAAFCGVKYAIATSSGTTAIHLALIASGIGAGNEVIVPSHTFIATAEPICHCGAVPVFVDVDPDTYNMDANLLEAAITPRTRAIIPVHLYGQCAEMDIILEIARKHKLTVIEDCAQAHGAKYKSFPAGTLGDFACFSFFPGKNLGAYGDAGMVVTNNEEHATRLRLLTNHGRKLKYEHEIIGYNYRMDALQAAILSVKLKRLATWTEARRRIARTYNYLLENLPIVTPYEEYWHAYHLYVIQCEERDNLAKRLKENGIATGIHYPVPLHQQPCFQHLPGIKDYRLPVTEKLASRILSLPIYPELTNDDQNYIAESIRRFFIKS
ncbi:DegT/DnrJ/EryC1/StrS family aminotransferase [Candidatus Sumerlaeota bacterium]|nr:DegT/DnrJ/EryC1/StrS family aminotransferase [Candidatus Sumerlaeota bacterium]